MRHKRHRWGANVDEFSAWFFTNIQVDENGCWNWQGGRFNTGYGRVHFYGKKRSVHRLAYAFAQSTITELNWSVLLRLWEKQLVCHKCNNRICINPTHLYLGNHQSNMDDAKRAGRINNKWTKNRLKVNDLKESEQKTKKVLDKPPIMC